MSGADFAHANLIEADLRGANLSGSRLVRCVLERADLRGADLRRALLSQLPMRAAKVEGVILEKAVLDCVDFTEVDLRPIKLAGLTITRCFFVRGNLSGMDLTVLQALLTRRSTSLTDISSAKNFAAMCPAIPRLKSEERRSWIWAAGLWGVRRLMSGLPLALAGVRGASSGLVSTAEDRNLRSLPFLQSPNRPRP